jgi:hypothetical protein
MKAVVIRRGRAALPVEPEADFQAAVVKLAHLLRWRSYHPWSSLHSPSGWPDLVLCRPPRLILAEVKIETGELSTAQGEWLADLRRCPGVETYTWRPSDFAEIKRVLGAAG